MMEIEDREEAIKDMEQANMPTIAEERAQRVIEGHKQAVNGAVSSSEYRIMTEKHPQPHPYADDWGYTAEEAYEEAMRPDDDEIRRLAHVEQFFEGVG
jgi:hypothetical protein